MRARSFHTSLDYLFDMKRASYRALAMYLRETGDPDLLLPANGPDPVLAELAPDEPFPNVVYKLPEIEQVNTSRRGQTTLVPGDEEPAAARAATAVARGLAWAAEYGFRTS